MQTCTELQVINGIFNLFILGVCIGVVSYVVFGWVTELLCWGVDLICSRRATKQEASNA